MQTKYRQALNIKYVREIWEKIPNGGNFWSREVLCTPLNDSNVKMPYLLSPEVLRKTLLALALKNESRKLPYVKKENEQEVEDGEVWGHVVGRAVWNKQLILFAQREYINSQFPDFNQLESLEDSNTPWDWDHIYPSSWIYRKHGVDWENKHWNSSNGNFRAMSLEENRSENNHQPPAARLEKEEARKNYFIGDDWEYWQKLKGEFKKGDTTSVENHIRATINRSCNIYAEWYNILNVGEIFGL